MKKGVIICVKTLSRQMKEDHVNAYAAQSAFFLLLSMIPIILLLLMLVQYTPVTKADVMSIAYKLFPSSAGATIVSMIDEVYNQSKAMIPLTALVASWSAGRGTLAITNGLNCIYKQKETRNYLFLRFRAAVYTILLVFAIVLSLVVLGFGNNIRSLVRGFVPEIIIELRTIISMGMIILFSTIVYRFFPNNIRKWKKQIPGAVFTAFGWTFFSFIFSIYIDIFNGFSNMYGSLTTIVIIMIWLYFCMYILFMGGEINVLLEQERTD